MPHTELTETDRSLTINRGTCFGFEVHSPLPCRFLRDGTGEPIRVTTHGGITPSADSELIVEWRADPKRRFHGRLYREPDGAYLLWASDAGWFRVDPQENTIMMPEEGDSIRREVRLWATPMLLFLVDRGDVSLHASAVEIDGRALALAGPSGSGKTTLAAALANEGLRVLGEDIIWIRFQPDPVVIPGPALLRLRKDLRDLWSLDGCELVGEDADRIYYAARGPGSSEPVPLHSVALLHTANGEIGLRPVEGADALRSLWPLSFHLPTPDDVSRCFDGITSIADLVPVANLQRPMDPASFPEVIQLLTESLR